MAVRDSRPAGRERNIVQIDSPVSGGVARRREGNAGGDGVGPARRTSKLLKPALDVIGKVFFIGDKPGSAPDHEARQQFLVGGRGGGDRGSRGDGRQGRARPRRDDRRDQCGLGRNSASRDKFPRAILPRTFDFGFTTGLMVKDVRLCPRRDEVAGTVDGSRRSGRAACGRS